LLRAPADVFFSDVPASPIFHLNQYVDPAPTREAGTDERAQPEEVPVLGRHEHHHGADGKRQGKENRGGRPNGWHACARYDTQVPRQGSKGFAAISPGAVFGSKPGRDGGTFGTAVRACLLQIDEQPGSWALHG
jgi:hypothetical protein